MKDRFTSMNNWYSMFVNHRKHTKLFLAILLTMIIPSGLLSGCGSVSNTQPEGNLILEDLTHRYHFNLDPEAPQSLTFINKGKKQKPMEGLGLRIFDIFNRDGDIIAKTTMSQSMDCYLTITPKDTIETKSVLLDGEGYKMGVGQKHIYHMISHFDYPPRVEIEVFDFDLNLVSSHSVSLEGFMLLPQAIEESDGYLWMLSGAVDENNWNGNAVTLLFKLSMDLEILEVIDLEMPDASAHDMTIVDGKMYYCRTMTGVDETGLGKGDKTIAMYDLETGENQSDYFILDEEFPYMIDYIPQLNQLLVTHDNSRSYKLNRSFISLDTGQVQSVEFTGEDGVTERDALFSVFGDSYLFLFDYCLIVVNAHTMETVVHDLTEYGFEISGAVFPNPA